MAAPLPTDADTKKRGAGVALFCDGKIPGGEIDRNGWMDGDVAVAAAEWDRRERENRR